MNMDGPSLRDFQVVAEFKFSKTFQFKSGHGVMDDRDAAFEARTR